MKKTNLKNSTFTRKVNFWLRKHIGIIGFKIVFESIKIALKNNKKKIKIIYSPESITLATILFDKNYLKTLECGFSRCHGGATRYLIMELNDPIRELVQYELEFPAMSSRQRKNYFSEIGKIPYLTEFYEIPFICFSTEMGPVSAYEFHRYHDLSGYVSFCLLGKGTYPIIGPQDGLKAEWKLSR